MKIKLSQITLVASLMTSGLALAAGGGGVVADSELAKEYRETWDKASSMLELVEAFGGDVSNQLDEQLYVGR